jgi:hypothetical protein
LFKILLERRSRSAALALILRASGGAGPHVTSVSAGPSVERRGPRPVTNLVADLADPVDGLATARRAYHRLVSRGARATTGIWRPFQIAKIAGYTVSSRRNDVTSPVGA